MAKTSTVDNSNIIERGYVQVKDKKILFIDFEKLLKLHLNDLDDADLNTATGYFHLKKRTYYGICDDIAETVDRYLSDENNYELVLSYIKLSYLIKSKEDELTLYELNDLIFSEILTTEVYESISSYIENIYDMNLDEESKNSKKVNNELLFTDRHVKILLKVAETMRLVAPLVTDFIDINSLNIDDTLYYVFYRIIELYEKDTNMKNKIKVFIDSRISNTKYNNSSIWKLLEDRGVNSDIMGDEFLKSIITGIIPKAKHVANVVNYLHVTIRNKLMYEFYKKFDTVISPVNLNQVDSEGLTLFDKFEINMNKIDESKALINSLSISSQIKRLISRYKLTITKSEFLYYKNNIHINNFQQKLIFLYFSKYVGGYENLYNANRNEYIFMILILQKTLYNAGYRMIPAYLTAIPDKREKRLNINKSKMIERIVTSKKYMDLISTKYKYAPVVDENIIKLIGGFNVSKFLNLPPYDIERKDLIYDKRDLEEVEINVEMLSNEILNFLEMI